jgi:Transposase IS66 family
VQAPAPARLIEGGLPTEAAVTEVLVSKYADHLTLYRQAQIWAREGISLCRSTLADWVGRAAWRLCPVHERLLARLKTALKLFADEMTRRCSIPVAARPRQATVGPCTDLGAQPTAGRGLCLCARPQGRVTKSRISTASAASCRSTATAAIARSPRSAA